MIFRLFFSFEIRILNFISRNSERIVPANFYDIFSHFHSNIRKYREQCLSDYWKLLGRYVLEMSSNFTRNFETDENCCWNIVPIDIPDNSKIPKVQPWGVVDVTQLPEIISRSHYQTYLVQTEYVFSFRIFFQSVK